MLSANYLDAGPLLMPYSDGLRVHQRRQQPQFII
jgi:hypothetical protein